MTLVGTILLRRALMYLLDGDMNGSFYDMLYEGDTLRFIANLKRIVTEWGSFQQFVATGFGVVFYLPFVFKSQSLRTRAVVVGSIFPLFPLVFVGNFFTELRIYGEYIPLMACLLATTIAWFTREQIAKSV